MVWVRVRVFAPSIIATAAHPATFTKRYTHAHAMIRLHDKLLCQQELVLVGYFVWASRPCVDDALQGVQQYLVMYRILWKEAKPLYEKSWTLV